jgi:hypothetical protein
MKIVDNKEVAKNVHLDVELANAQLAVAMKLDVLVVAGPILDKIAELIPGHFEDGLIEEAKKKLAELAAAPSA